MWKLDKHLVFCVFGLWLTSSFENFSSITDYHMAPVYAHFTGMYARGGLFSGEDHILGALAPQPDTCNTSSSITRIGVHLFGNESSISSSFLRCS